MSEDIRLKREKGHRRPVRYRHQKRAYRQGKNGGWRRDRKQILETDLYSSDVSTPDFPSK
jgi:hypothetical protein